MVPEALLSKHKGSTVTLLCRLPADYEHSDEFILGLTDSSLGIRLRYDVQRLSIIPLLQSEEVLLAASPRPLMLCMARVLDPLPYLAETVAYYVSQGFDHIFIGTAFWGTDREEKLRKLIEIVRPWFDDGKISIFDSLLSQDEGVHIGGMQGQSHFNIQCLYLAKAFGGEFALNVDADEFLLFHDGMTIRDHVLGSDHGEMSSHCWATFYSYDVWKLTDPASSYMVDRYSEIRVYSEVDYLSITCKTMWNVRVMWSAEVHGGGACNIDNRDWNDAIISWHGNVGPEVQDLVLLMDVQTKASIRHFTNAFSLRLGGPETAVTPSQSFDDRCALQQLLWSPIKKELAQKGVQRATFAGVDRQRFDILHHKDYVKVFGEGNGMKHLAETEEKSGQQNDQSDRNKMLNPLYDPDTLKCE